VNAEIGRGFGHEERDGTILESVTEHPGKIAAAVARPAAALVTIAAVGFGVPVLETGAAAHNALPEFTVAGEQLPAAYDTDVHVGSEYEAPDLTASLYSGTASTAQVHAFPVRLPNANGCGAAPTFTLPVSASMRAWMGQVERSAPSWALTC